MEHTTYFCDVCKRETKKPIYFTGVAMIGETPRWVDDFSEKCFCEECARAVVVSTEPPEREREQSESSALTDDYITFKEFVKIMYEAWREKDG